MKLQKYHDDDEYRNSYTYTAPQGGVESSYESATSNATTSNVVGGPPRGPSVKDNFFCCCNARVFFAAFMIVVIICILAAPVFTILVLEIQGDCYDSTQWELTRRELSTAAVMCDATDTACSHTQPTLRWTSYLPTQMPKSLTNFAGMGLSARIAHLLGADTKDVAIDDVSDAVTNGANEDKHTSTITAAAFDAANDTTRLHLLSVPTFAMLLSNISVEADTHVLRERYENMLRQAIQLGNESLRAITAQYPRHPVGRSTSNVSHHHHHYNHNHKSTIDGDGNLSTHNQSNTTSYAASLTHLPDLTVFTDAPMLLAQASEDCYLLPSCWHGGGRVAMELTSTLVSRIVLITLRAVLSAVVDVDADTPNASEHAAWSGLTESLSALVHLLCHREGTAAPEHDASDLCLSFTALLNAEKADIDTEGREESATKGTTTEALAQRMREATDDGGAVVAPDLDAFHFAVHGAWVEEILRIGQQALALRRAGGASEAYHLGRHGSDAPGDAGRWSAHAAVARRAITASATREQPIQNVSLYDSLTNALDDVYTAAESDLGELHSACSYTYDVFRDVCLVCLGCILIGLGLHVMLLFMVRYRVYRSPTSFRVMLCLIAVMCGIFVGIEAVTLYMASLLKSSAHDITRSETVAALQRYNATFHAVDALSRSWRGAVSPNTTPLLFESATHRAADTVAAFAAQDTRVAHHETVNESARAMHSRQAQAIAEHTQTAGMCDDGTTSCAPESRLLAKARVVYAVLDAYGVTSARLLDAHTSSSAPGARACESYAMGMAMGATQVAMTDLMHEIAATASGGDANLTRRHYPATLTRDRDRAASALEYYCRVVGERMIIDDHGSTHSSSSSHRCSARFRATVVSHVANASCCVPTLRDCVSGLGLLAASAVTDVLPRTEWDTTDEDKSVHTTYLMKLGSTSQQAQLRGMAKTRALRRADLKTNKDQLLFEPETALLWTALIGSIVHALFTCVVWHLLMGDNIFYDLL